jgi:hypothetical protein
MQPTALASSLHTYRHTNAKTAGARMLTWLAVAVLSAGCFLPTLAHSQTAAASNRTVCNLSGSGLSLNQSLQSTNFLFSTISLGKQATAGGACSPVVSAFAQSLAHNTWSNFNLALQRSRQEAGVAFIAPGRAGDLPNRGVALSLPGSNATSARSFTITDDTWTGHTGLWSVSGNWSSGIPTTNNNAVITNSSSVVTEDINGSINNLTLSSGNSLSLNDAVNLTIGGNTISNAGTISINSTGDTSGLRLSDPGSVTLSGGGTLTLSDSVNPQNVITGVSGTVLVNQETIKGSGTISQLALTNSGTIDADNADHGLTIQANGVGVTNTGTLEANNGATLLLNGNTYDNRNGTIRALNGGVVQLQSATFQGGTFTTDSGHGSTIETGFGTTVGLDGTTQGAITNSGAFAVGNNSTVQLLGGTINNTGSITLNGTLYRSTLQLSASTTLQGSGTLTLVDSGNPQNFISGVSGSDILTNKQTIQGSGVIGNGSMGLNNTGTIDADNADNSLTINTNSGTTNTGTLEATNGATLFLANDTFNNSGGTIKATGGSSVQLASGVTIEGGTLSTDSGHGSTIGSAYGSNITLDGSTKGTLNNASAYVVANNSTTNLVGTINNTGSITLETAGNYSQLILKGNTTLTGSGTVVLNPFTGPNNNYFYGATNTTQLTNVNNTISGAGTVGDGQMILVNQAAGTIDANVAGQTLTVSVSGNSVGSGVNGTNAGLLESTALSSTLGPSYLALNGGTINNTGGTIKAINGGAVQLLNGIVIQGGTLTTDSGHGSVIETVYGNNAVLDGSTQGTLANSGALSVVGNSTLYTKGTINNTGSITLNGSYNNSVMLLAGNTTLSGSGTVTLADSANPQNYIYAQSGTYTLTNRQTIQGAGDIGNNAMALNNSGIIDADYADHSLEINTTNGSTNTGTLEATNGATLYLGNDVFNNTGGTIKATSGSSVQLLNGATIEGGTLSTDSGHGSTIGVYTGNSATLDGSTQGTLNNASAFNVANNSTAYIKGTINNTGSITLNSLGNSSQLILHGDTTLTGSGNIVLSPSAISNNYLYGASNTNTLTNTNNTISGAGVIGDNSLIFVNQHGAKVNANVAGQSLTVSVSGNTVGSGVNGTNAGVMESSATNPTLGPSSLILNGGTINNTGGTIHAENGGVVQLYNGVTIQGGSLSTDTAAGSLIETVTGDRSVTLDGSTQGTLTLSGAFAVSNNSSVFTTGTIHNLGSITLNGAYYGSYLELAGNTTLTGSGTVTLVDNGNPQNYIYSRSGSAVLTNQQTIQGSGDIGNNEMGLTNSGTINADNADHGLEINTSAGTTNTGTLEATNGATLELATDIFNNKNGTIKATGGSTVQLANNVTIQGGTLSSDSTSKFALPYGNGATLDGATQGTLTNATTLSVANNSTLFVKGTINNTGSITLNSAGNNSTLELTANTTLTGSGTVTLTNSTLPSNYIYGSSGAFVLTNQNNLIQGTGTIADGQMGLINNGTILSNGSGLTIQPSSSGFTNNGTLQVAAGSFMHVLGGPFTNFASNTLTGGSYNVSGNLEIDQLGSTGGEIKTNAANITLNGATSSFVDSAGKDALSSLNTNAATGIFTISGGRNFTTQSDLTNNGTLGVGTGSKFVVSGNLTNFSGTTLTGGVYNIGGTLQFTGANIVTNAATISLSGSAAQIVNQSGSNGLANFATNAAAGVFEISSSHPFTTAGNFTNNGTIVNTASSKFTVNGNLTNFSGTTLTGGTYQLSGIMQFNGANIVTNSAKILLNGTAAGIQDQHGANGLANFATNNTSGTFVMQGGLNFTTVGSFTNKGAFTVGSGSTFTVGGSATSYTQTAGTTTDDGSLKVPTSGALTVSAGSLFGTGAITGAVASSGTVIPGNSSTSTGILQDTGAYTQNTAGALDISIGGTTAGTKYDQLNPTTASLHGTLNVSLINGYVPTVGAQFKIMNFTSETGTFGTVNGLSINSSEHFTISYQGTDVLLTVVSGPLSAQEGNGGLHLPTSASVLGSPNLENELHAGLTSHFNPSAVKGVPTNTSFRAAAASVMASPAAPAAQTAFTVPQNRTATHVATSGLHFPTRIGSSSSKTTANNGAYGLRTRTVGAGFAFPMTHFSKPQMGFVVE